MATIRSFEELDVWKLGREIRQQCYRVAKALPAHERFNLAAQIRSAAVSLTANIAEGYGRFHYRENSQFCRIARGSAYELLDHLIACHDEGYVGEKDIESMRRIIDRFCQMINGYIRTIGRHSKALDE